MGWACSRHSHPVASADCAVSIRSVNACSSSTLQHLAARARDSIGLSGSRLAGGGVLGGVAAVLVVLSIVLASCLGNSLGVLLILIDGPVEDIVVLETLTNEEVAEDLAKIAVVRLVVEAERASVVEVDSELVREATASVTLLRLLLPLNDKVQ